MLVDAWSDFQRLHPLVSFMPSHVDLESLPSVQPMMDSLSTAEPTIDVFHAVVREALPSIYTWRTTRLENIARAVQSHLPSGCGIAGLQLAVCVFCCTNLTRHTLQSQRDPMQYFPMWYPQYLYHSCNNIVKLLPSTFTDEPLEAIDLSLRLIPRYHGYYRTQWDSRLLMFNSRASHAVREILEVLGVDYRTTTVSNLDAMDTWIYCNACNAADQHVWSAIPWRLAVRRRVTRQSLSF